MSRFLYHTDGLILSSRSLGEAGRLLDIFTIRLGRVTALAAGVRELKSKLRYSLQDLTSVRLSLVASRGSFRAGEAGRWRIVHAESDNLLPPRAELADEQRIIVARLLGLISRLVVAEGSRVGLYRELTASFRFLTGTRLSQASTKSYELLAVLRLLVNLGYCRKPIWLEPFIGRQKWERTMLESFLPHHSKAAAIVDEALYHSHL